MTEQEKIRLDEQLEQAAKQLTHALRALRTGQNQHAAVYVGNVQNLLPGLRMRLGRQVKMREFNVENMVISNDFRIRPSMKVIEESNEYRLFKRKNGELILQRKFIEITSFYDDGSKMMKPIWKEIETVNEE